MRTISWNTQNDDPLSAFGLYSPNTSLDRIDISAVLRRIIQHSAKTANLRRHYDSFREVFSVDSSSVLPKMETTGTSTAISTLPVIGVSLFDVEYDMFSALLPNQEITVTAKITNITKAEPPTIDLEDLYG